jgi:hypothetical protein
MAKLKPRNPAPEVSAPGRNQPGAVDPVRALARREFMAALWAAHRRGVGTFGDQALHLSAASGHRRQPRPLSGDLRRLLTDWNVEAQWLANVLATGLPRATEAGLDLSWLHPPDVQRINPRTRAVVPVYVRWLVDVSCCGKSHRQVAMAAGKSAFSVSRGVQLARGWLDIPGDQPGRPARPRLSSAHSARRN